jgi:hypothetical protein
MSHAPLRWGRALALLISVTVGVVAGILGVQLRDWVTEVRTQPGMIGNPPVVTSDTDAIGSMVDFGSASVVVNLFNVGGRDAAVTDLRIPGWQLSADSPAVKHAIPPRQWVSIAVDLDVDCGSDVLPSDLVEVVSDDAVIGDVDLGDDLRWRHQAACDQSWISGIDAGDITFTRIGDAFEVSIEIVNNGPDPITIADLETGTFSGGDTAFDVAHALPMELDGAESVTVTTEWRVENCRLLTTTESFHAMLSYERGIATSELHISLPHDIVAEIARYSVTECP